MQYLEYFLPVFNCGWNYAGLDYVSLHRAQLLNTGVVEHLKYRIKIRKEEHVFAAIGNGSTPYPPPPHRQLTQPL
jgi:hypothetical protein